MDEILERAKHAFEFAMDIPYPAGLEISDRWQENQATSYNEITNFKSIHEAICRAQSHKSGFDHREFDHKQISRFVNFKLHILQSMYHSLPEVEESPLSIEESIVTRGGRRLSSIFLTHLYFYLRTADSLRGHSRILEIGSGYGGLARIFQMLRPVDTYVLVDLPESLFYAQVFLEANFPQARMFYMQGQVAVDINQYDFVFVPVQNAHILAGQEFDLTINTGSLQEMPAAAVFYWMDFIQRVIKTDKFYSWNYFLNDKSKFSEARGATSLICPILDPMWEVLHFRINEPILTIDCNQRNWLEVFLKRIPFKESFDSLEYSNSLIERANQYPAWTNQWFACIWMAVWANPIPHLIDALLKGIDQFTKGEAFAIQNYLSKDTKFDELTFYDNVKNYPG